MPKAEAVSSLRNRRLPVTDEEPDQYFSRAVAKALDALDRLSASAEPLTLKELSAELGLTKASAFRILHTLERLGHISKAKDGKFTAVGAPPHSAAGAVDQIIRCVARRAKTLSLETAETVGVAALQENRIEVIYVAESPQVLRTGNTLGRILPPHASSLGKVVAAFQSPETQERLVRSYGLNRFTPTTITDELALREEFARICDRGYAEDWEESTPGACCFAAPIFKGTEHAVAGISVSLPRMRLASTEQQRVFTERAVQAAEEISAALRRKDSAN